MKKIYLIVVILISHPLFSKNLFESSINDVEFISNDIENEKINKIEKIKIESLLNIFEKILDEENYLIVKKKLNKDLVNVLIKNIVINDEKIIDNNYYSKIKINFNKKKIISLLRDLKVPYVEYYPKNILLIIYSENNINYHLFSENNQYYSYIKKNLDNYKIFSIPNLDINDRFILKKEDLLEKNTDKIKTFSNKYKTNEVAVIIIKNKNKKINLNLLIYSDGIVLEKEININELNYENFFLFLENEIINDWKKINQIQNLNLNMINCEINYYNLNELKEIKKNINNISVINNYDIKSISNKKIEYDIFFYGNFKILDNLFNIHKLKINYTSNICKISLI